MLSIVRSDAESEAIRQDIIRKGAVFSDGQITAFLMTSI